MKVKLSKYHVMGGAGAYDVDDKVTCALNGAEVEIRQSEDGASMIVVIRNGRDNRIHMESRAAAVWIEVKPE